MLERLFHLRARDTTPRREVLAGATTFLTMAYIVIVNPSIMAAASFTTASSLSISAGRGLRTEPHSTPYFFRMAFITAYRLP